MTAIIRYGLVILLFGWLLVNGIIPAWSEVYSDFANYYVSARLIWDGADLSMLYDNNWFAEQIRSYGIDTPGKFSPFPPITSFVMLPIAWMEPIDAMRSWLVIKVLFCVAFVTLTRKITAWHWSVCLLILLALGNGLINDFRNGQVYLPLATGLFWIIVLSEEKKNALAGFLLGLLACLKYVPVAIIGSMLINKNMRPVAISVLTIALLTIGQVVFFGWAVMKDFLAHVLLPHLDGELSGQPAYSLLFQSWDSFLRHLFVYSAEHNPHPFIDFAAGRVIVKLVVFVTALGVLFLSIRRIQTLALSELARNRMISAFLLLSALALLPASASYHFALLSIPVILLLSIDFFRRTETTLIIITYVLIGIIPYGRFFDLAERAGLVFAYPRLWLISILYFGCTWIVLRRKSVPAQA